MNRSELHDRLIQTLADYFEDTYQIEIDYRADLISLEDLSERVIARDEVAINEILKATDEWYTRYERTCHSVDEIDATQFFVCSNCNFGADDIEPIPNYCPKCGAKVVRNGS